MVELATEIQINSRPEIVWKILTDFKNYSQWNPIIIKIIGELSIGNKLEINVNKIGGNNIIYNKKIKKINNNNELRWKGKFFSSKIFAGERIFSIEKLSDNKVNFVNKEIFSGIGLKLVSQKTADDILASFKKMN